MPFCIIVQAGAKSTVTNSCRKKIIFQTRPDLRLRRPACSRRFGFGGESERRDTVVHAKNEDNFDTASVGRTESDVDTDAFIADLWSEYRVKHLRAGTDFSRGISSSFLWARLSQKALSGLERESRSREEVCDEEVTCCGPEKHLQQGFQELFRHGGFRRKRALNYCVRAFRRETDRRAHVGISGKCSFPSLTFSFRLHQSL